MIRQRAAPDSRQRLAPQDLAACRDLIREGSRSFDAAARLLPRDVREAALALYAFCRVADDAIDESREPARALQQIGWRLSRACAGRPADDPVDRAFAWVVHRYDIPQAIPEALLQGFAWDAEGRRYATLDAVKAYGARVAGTVGVMMALVMGARSREALARAADLGIAMQLTNIARDIGEDARAGRCYLPQAWLAGAGLTEQDIAAAAEAPEAVRAMTRALLEEADGLYRSGLAGLGYLPPACRPAIRAAALIYARIGRVIARSGYDSVSGRAVVSGRRKAALAARAMLPGGALGDFASGPADPSCRFLIEAVPPAAGETSPAGAAGWAWAIDLFIELERRNNGRLPAFAGERSGARHA